MNDAVEVRSDAIASVKFCAPASHDVSIYLLNRFLLREGIYFPLNDIEIG